MSRSAKAKAITIVALCLGLTIVNVGCTSTRAYTAASDEIGSVAAESSVFLVSSNLQDRALAQQMEQAFIDSLALYGMEGLSWTQLFPPLRKHDTGDYVKAMRNNGVDIVVFADLQDSGTTTGIVSDYQGGMSSTTSGYAMFEFTFFTIDFDDPVFLTQINVDGDELAGWRTINAAASRRAVREYAKAAGIKRQRSSSTEGGTP
jgi:hypothetical protein